MIDHQTCCSVYNSTDPIAVKLIQFILGCAKKPYVLHLTRTADYGAPRHRHPVDLLSVLATFMIIIPRNSQQLKELATVGLTCCGHSTCLSLGDPCLIWIKCQQFQNLFSRLTWFLLLVQRISPWIVWCMCCRGKIVHAGNRIHNLLTQRQARYQLCQRPKPVGKDSSNPGHSQNTQLHMPDRSQRRSQISVPKRYFYGAASRCSVSRVSNIRFAHVARARLWYWFATTFSCLTLA